MGSTIFQGSGRLSRLILRRDRLRIFLWLAGICFFTIIVPTAFAELYATQQSRDVMALTMENPAMTAMVGPADLSNYTIGVMTAHQMLLFTALVVGLMSIILVARHTRGDEEDGRIELVRSLPVGRLSNLHAAILVYSAVYILLALLIGFGLYALQIESMDLEGSLLYGAVLGATGILFAGVTALFAQISESSRGTIGFAIAVLLIAYLLRAIGDVSSETLSWISPLGWVTKSSVYGENNWLPVIIMLVLSIVLIVIANLLNARRDLGAGLLQSKPGREHASRSLQSPFGLAWRLQRTGLISWAIGMYVIGASYGSVLGDLDAFFESSDILRELFASSGGGSVTEQFLSMIMIVMAILATIPPVIAMNKLYGEERRNRTEHLTARSVSRTRLMGSFLAVSVINGFLMLSLTAVGLWSASMSLMDEPISFGTIYGMAIVYYPAMLVMISAAVLLIGWCQKLTSVVWLYILYSFFTLYLGSLFQFPDWVTAISPFGHIPEWPIDEMTWTPLLVLTVLAAFVSAVGFVGYNRRDMEG